VRAVSLSPEAGDDLEHLYDFALKRELQRSTPNFDVPERALAAITSALRALALSPFMGRKVRSQFEREIVISFGRTAMLHITSSRQQRSSSAQSDISARATTTDRSSCAAARCFPLDDLPCTDAPDKRVPLPLPPSVPTADDHPMTLHRTLCLSRTGHVCKIKWQAARADAGRGDTADVAVWAHAAWPGARSAACIGQKVSVSAAICQPYELVGSRRLVWPKKSDMLY